MYNLRYHIASLVAVFLALSVGLLLGTVVAERGTISTQTNTLIRDLQKRFDDINVQNQQLQQGLERDRAFADAAVGPLTAGRLAGKNVMIVANVGGTDSVKSVSQAVRAASGTPFTLTLQQTALGLDKSQPAELLAYFQQRALSMQKPGAALEKQVATAVLAEWRAGAAHPLTDLLVQSGLATLDGAPAAGIVDSVVALGGVNASADPFALALVRAANAAGGKGMAAEAAPSDNGVARVASAEGISAIDNADTPEGRYALVAILSGRARGYFGSGKGADAFYPPLVP